MTLYKNNKKNNYDSTLGRTMEINIGDQIRKQRKALKLSQSHLGEKLGITHQQIHKYEKGIDRIPASTLHLISKILNTSIEYFYESMNEDHENQLMVFNSLNGKVLRILDLDLDIKVLKTVNGGNR